MLIFSTPFPTLFADSSEKGNQVNAVLFEWREYSAKLLAHSPKFGENPVVYYYQVMEDDESDKVAIRHVFYEGVVIDVLFGPPDDFSNTINIT